jgi:hypothetical protein
MAIETRRARPAFRGRPGRASSSPNSNVGPLRGTATEQGELLGTPWRVKGWPGRPLPFEGDLTRRGGQEPGDDPEAGWTCRSPRGPRYGDELLGLHGRSMPTSQGLPAPWGGGRGGPRYGFRQPVHDERAIPGHATADQPGRRLASVRGEASIIGGGVATACTSRNGGWTICGRRVTAPAAILRARGGWRWAAPGRRDGAGGGGRSAGRAQSSMTWGSGACS